jgi:deoxycytidylate deaminase
MKLTSTQYIPVDNKGNPLQLETQRLAYHARSFVWQEITQTQKALEYIKYLSYEQGQVEFIYEKMANEAAQADCERRTMGCVVTDSRANIIAMGHNAKPYGLEGTCHQIGCVPALTCRLTNHAETNTLDKIHTITDSAGYILFNTAVPCLNCLKVCKVRNVRCVVYREAREQDEFDRPILSALSISSGIVFLKLELEN